MKGEESEKGELATLRRVCAACVCVHRHTGTGCVHVCCVCVYVCVLCVCSVFAI